MYTSDFLRRVFEQEGRGIFDARHIVLGQTQQGGSPTPFDRILADPAGRAQPSPGWATQIAAGTRTRRSSACTRAACSILPLRAVEELADRPRRRPVDQWWMRLRPTVDRLAARTTAPRRQDVGSDVTGV